MSDPVRIVVGSGESAEIRVASSSESAEIRIPESGLIVGPPGPQGPAGADGSDGQDGTDGTTFTPSVDSSGNLSWTNDGGKQNPPTVNIKGPAGNDGNDGEDGEDGVSPTVTFSTITGGHTMTVTDKDHPSGQSINIMDGSSSSLTILSYGNSTWADFLTAYNAKSLVYCRASSNADPATGIQGRFAFMAYVNLSNGTPTRVEFQYYRSVSAHSDSQQGDQVFVYALTNAGVWSVTIREAYTKIVAGSNMSSSYSNGTLTLSATGGGGGTSLTAGDGLDITNDVIKNTQGIEYIVGTQTAATAAWTGVSTDETLKVGKIIAYYLPYAGTSTAATLTLTMAGGTSTAAIPLRRQATGTVTTQFAAGNVIILIYDGDYWRVSAYYDTTTNTVPTGYCQTAAATAEKVATCSYGYRGDTNYFPCLFRYANTAANATLEISSYATTALPIYVNGARTSSTNTFGRGVILFLFYNNAYYCYNDGRLPILVDGVVTSVQEYVETKYTKPSGGIPASDLASAVQTSLGKADSALQSVPSTYRTAAAQDAIDEGILGNLATIESSQATAAHAVGEYIVLNGQLYKVTAAIAAGQTLTVGTNISAVSGGGLNDLKRIVNYNPTLLASGVTLLGRSLMTVYGEFFFFRAVVNVTTAQAQDAELFQLPNYNYGTTTTANVLVSRVDGGNGYTTVSIAANNTIRVVLPGGMATGRYEILLFGKCT